MRQLLLLGLFTLIGLFGAFLVAHAQTMTFAWSDKAIYDAWEPKYTNTITFTATVSGLYDAKAYDGNIRFDFERVSNWDGSCMNADEGNRKTKQDLIFKSEDQSDPTPLKWQNWKDGEKNKVAADWKSSDKLDSFTINITVRKNYYDT